MSHITVTDTIHPTEPTTMPTIGDSDMKILKVISLLIDYPNDELFVGDTLNQCQQLIQNSIVISPEVRGQLCELIADLQAIGALEAQARYDGLFERGRSLSLWLFEHVHGESRDRGQAMVDLMNQYEQAGFAIGVKELPDFLPLYLEFLAYQAVATQDDIQVRMDIADVSHIIALLAARLKDRNSPYLACFNALLQIAGKPLTEVDSYLEDIRKERRDDSKEALDKEWEEEAVDFLAAEQQERCPSQSNALMLNADKVKKNVNKNIDAPVHWVDFTTTPSRTPATTND